ncbi:UNVERIFIED_CONTAM: putative N-acetyl-gamma-glutamyl-phosphate reductase, chloroplastic [Sesamum latifolium]|uniref:N-acetyl-gamma-glutamyl-phosphate reductase, chloroplastic n=1 Tax=Sesamum latifolium TaxID=2727402 RepID=A0AAW2XKV1_9LAMI
MGSLSSLNSICIDGGCFVKYQDKVKDSMVKKLCVRASVAQSVPQNLEIKAQKSDKFRIGVLGASGYTGSETSCESSELSITLMTADRKAGQSIGSVFPHLVRQDLPDMVAVKDADFSTVDAVFCCLPHGTTQEIIKGLPSSLKIVDLSADFRLQDIAEYEEWYGQPHRAQELQKEAVYGLTEISRSEIQNARLVANPGCYPTSIQLPLIPLIKANLIEVKNIIIDSKSGVSGAGRGAKEANLYTEIAEGIHSYGITRHRHVPEIEQGLSEAAKKVTVSFTPHLMPMFILPSYVELLLHLDYIPENLCSGHADDNLVKGASGQALQNLNLMMGIPETTGLLSAPLFP